MLYFYSLICGCGCGETLAPMCGCGCGWGYWQFGHDMCGSGCGWQNWKVNNTATRFVLQPSSRKWIKSEMTNDCYVDYIKTTCKKNFVLCTLCPSITRDCQIGPPSTGCKMIH